MSNPSDIATSNLKIQASQKHHPNTPNDSSQPNQPSKPTLANDSFQGYKFIMFDPATKAPNFTPANAADMARRSAVSRVARIEREKAENRQRDIEARALAISRETVPDPDEARKNATLKQIDRLDKMIDAALTRADEDTFLKLAGAKEKLWKLVQPTAGVLKNSKRAIRSAPAVQFDDSQT